MSLATRLSASARWSRCPTASRPLGAADDRADPVTDDAGDVEVARIEGAARLADRPAARPTDRRHPGSPPPARAVRPAGPRARRRPGRRPAGWRRAARGCAGPGRWRAPASDRAGRFAAGHRGDAGDRSSRRARHPPPRAASGDRPCTSQTATRWWPYASRTARTTASRASSGSSDALIERATVARIVRSSWCRSASSGSAGAGSASPRRPLANRAAAAGSIVRRPPHAPVAGEGMPSTAPVSAAARKRWRSLSR